MATLRCLSVSQNRSMVSLIFFFYFVWFHVVWLDVGALVDFEFGGRCWFLSVEWLVCLKECASFLFLSFIKKCAWREPELCSLETLTVLSWDPYSRPLLDSLACARFGLWVRLGRHTGSNSSSRCLGSTFRQDEASRVE